MNDHETVGFKSDDSANAVEGLVLRENIFLRVFCLFGVSFHLSLPVILVQEMNGVPFREENGLASVFRIVFGHGMDPY
ncbi:hypothetical protein OIU85_021620 [Salix viminalis]|uniref:Uncharacterized protein n=1 Tax=Salix viminalis TaxID=40686 RepID=A0A9Q0UIX7_SALVM|nr:hypothetical protein OIU85_021620 [Salix viminalis]